MDFIVMYCERWDTPLRTSKHHYISRIAADGHRVLYVEVPSNPISALWRWHEFRTHTIPRLQAGVAEVAKNTWALTGVVPLPYHPALGGIFDHPWVNHLNQQIMLPRIQSAMNKLGFVNPILINYYPLAYPILNKLGASRTVFHIVDEWQGMKGIPRSMARLTQQMLNHADVTIVTSGRLFDRYKTTAKRIELLRHGTDLSLFAPVAKGSVIPDLRLQGISGKKIGYYGALHKLDTDLIIQVARSRPEWTFLFVGPLAGGQGMGHHDHFPANIMIQEALPRTELPTFLAGLDVFWMPFVVNELTQSMCPIKLYEVLSAGLPLVSSDLQECRAVAAEHGLFAVDVKTHIEQLERAFHMKSPVEAMHRVQAMQDYDWNNRYRDFLAFILT